MLTRDEVECNRYHENIRMTVENAVGRLKTVFRCLLKDRVLHYHPTFAGSIVNAAATLHNFRINHQVQDPDSYEDDSDEDGESEVDDDSDGDFPPRDPIGDVENEQPRGRRPTHPGELCSQAGADALRRYLANHFHNN